MAVIHSIPSRVDSLKPIPHVVWPTQPSASFWKFPPHSLSGTATGIMANAPCEWSIGRIIHVSADWAPIVMTTHNTTIRRGLSPVYPDASHKSYMCTGQFYLRFIIPIHISTTQSFRHVIRSPSQVIHSSSPTPILGA